MYETLNDEINNHVDYVLHEPVLINYIPDKEWEEIEHTDFAMNPVFITIYDADFKLVDKSPNLTQNTLEWDSKQPEKEPYYIQVDSINLLASQAPLIHHGQTVGYVIAAVSTKHNQLALDYLDRALLYIFPISIFLIFITARYTARNAVHPVFKVIQTAQKITDYNLSERVPLPKNKDELYQLSITINALLDRLETQINNAKQFSADASHELRTPLSIIKGTLEVLIRKERSPLDYHKNIHYTLLQVERLNRMVEQFLMLSRIENKIEESKQTALDFRSEVEASIGRLQFLIDEKNMTYDTSNLMPHTHVNTRLYLEIILDNILSNAIKHGSLSSVITVQSKRTPTHYILEFENATTPIPESQLQHFSERYFRTTENQNTTPIGYGLGLNIANKLAEIEGWTLRFENQPLDCIRVSLITPL